MHAQNDTRKNPEKLAGQSVHQVGCTETDGLPLVFLSPLFRFAWVGVIGQPGSPLRRSFFDPSTLEPLYEGMHYSDDGVPSITK